MVVVISPGPRMLYYSRMPDGRVLWGNLVRTPLKIENLD